MVTPRVVAAFRSEKRLKVWMRNRFDDLAPVLGRGRVPWKDVVRLFAEDGVRDRFGKPPTLSAVQQAWYALKREKAAEKLKQSNRVSGDLRAGPIVKAPAADAVKDVPTEEALANLQEFLKGRT